MKCNICGAEMRALRQGLGKGAKGAKRKCPNTPHRKCPMCNSVLLTKFHPAVCMNCGYKETGDHEQLP